QHDNGQVQSVLRRFKDAEEEKTRMARLDAELKRIAAGPPPPTAEADPSEKLLWIARTTEAKARAHVEEHPDWLKLQDRSKNTILHQAARFKPELAVWLLEQGLDPNAENDVGQTPLTLYFQKGSDLAMTKKFLEVGADPFRKPRHNIRPVAEAANRGSRELLDLLFAARETIEPAEIMELFAQTFGRSKESILSLYLIEKGLMDVFGDDVKQWKSLPVHRVAGLGRLDLYQALEKRKLAADVADLSGRFPLHLSVRGRSRDLVEYLLAQGRDVNQLRLRTGDTPLMAAVRAGWLEGVEFLLAEGADKSIKDTEGWTAGYYAQQLPDNQKMLELLAVEPMTEMPQLLTDVIEAKLGKPIDGIKGYTWATV
ncbi:MAG: ankyrin repeat domain-containing protein, partial [Verrucomicrobiota bacterium]